MHLPTWSKDLYVEDVKDSNVRSKLYEAYSYPLTRSKESHQETKRQQTLLLLERLERQAVGEEINASDIKESIGKIKESLAISEECSFEQEMIVLKSEDTFQKEIMDIIKMIQGDCKPNTQCIRTTIGWTSSTYKSFDHVGKCTKQCLRNWSMII